ASVEFPSAGYAADRLNAPVDFLNPLQILPNVCLYNRQEDVAEYVKRGSGVLLRSNGIRGGQVDDVDFGGTFVDGGSEGRILQNAAVDVILTHDLHCREEAWNRRRGADSRPYPFVV